MNARGYSLFELLTVVALLLILASVAAPWLKAYTVESHLLGAGYVFKHQFLRARSMAVRSNVKTAIRFEVDSGGSSTFSLYVDGNYNGVLATDIRSGTDRRIEGPFRLDGGAPGVRVGILPGVPAIPPDSGTLDTSDPIRFGRSNMVSFSPDGTATPGTFYLAGEGIQAAVRVNAMTSRVRLMVCRKGGRWVQR
jgi:prepilin-type N-terminal cleavage/methylation domain-containing protein